MSKRSNTIISNTIISNLIANPRIAVNGNAVVPLDHHMGSTRLPNRKGEYFRIPKGEYPVMVKGKEFKKVKINDKQSGKVLEVWDDHLIVEIYQTKTRIKVIK